MPPKVRELRGELQKAGFREEAMNALAEPRYSVVIAWSDEDQAYIASFPDFPTLHTHGATRREALENAEQVLDMAAEDHQTAAGFRSPLVNRVTIGIVKDGKRWEGAICVRRCKPAKETSNYGRCRSDGSQGINHPAV